MPSSDVVSVSKATRPVSLASAIQASRRARSRTVSYLERSKGVALAAVAAAPAACAGVGPDGVAGLAGASPELARRLWCGRLVEVGAAGGKCGRAARNGPDAARAGRGERRVGLDGAGVEPVGFRHTARRGGELHRLEECDQALRIGVVHADAVERAVERHVLVEQHEPARKPRLLGVLDQRLPPLGLADLADAGQQRSRGRHIR